MILWCCQECMQVPRALRELSEQLEVFCEGHNCLTPLSVLSPLQIFKDSSPESFLDVRFGSSLESFHSEDLQPVAVQVLFLTATFTHTMMSILGEPSLTFSDHRKISSFGGSRDGWKRWKEKGWSWGRSQRTESRLFPHKDWRVCCWFQPFA